MPTVSAQVLLYPSLSNTMSTSSWKEYGADRFPQREVQLNAMRAYIPEGLDIDDPWSRRWREDSRVYRPPWCWSVYSVSIRHRLSLKTPVRDILARVSVPALVGWGDHDPLFSVEIGRRTAGLIPAAQWRLYPAAGHFLPIEQPDELTTDLTALLGEPLGHQEKSEVPPARPSGFRLCRTFGGDADQMQHDQSVVLVNVPVDLVFSGSCFDRIDTP